MTTETPTRPYRRPSLPAPVTIRLPHPLRQQVEACAMSAGLTRTGFMRLAIQRAVDQAAAVASAPAGAQQAQQTARAG
jgi:predicted transcriptional regulator